MPAALLVERLIADAEATLARSTALLDGVGRRGDIGAKP